VCLTIKTIAKFRAETTDWLASGGTSISRNTISGVHNVLVRIKIRVCCSLDTVIIQVTFFHDQIVWTNEALIK